MAFPLLDHLDCSFYQISKIKTEGKFGVKIGFFLAYFVDIFQSLYQLLFLICCILSTSTLPVSLMVGNSNFVFCNLNDKWNASQNIINFLLQGTLYRSPSLPAGRLTWRFEINLFIQYSFFVIFQLLRSRNGALVTQSFHPSLSADICIEDIDSETLVNSLLSLANCKTVNHLLLYAICT